MRFLLALGDRKSAARTNDLAGDDAGHRSFVVFEFRRGVVSMEVVYVANGFPLPATMRDSTFLVIQVSPSTVYTAALTALLPDVADSPPTQTFAGRGIDAVAERFRADLPR